MLQPLGFALIFMTVGAVVVAIAESLFARPATRIVAGALAGAWLGIVVVASISGAIKELPLFGAVFALIPVVAILAALTNAEVRARMLNASPRIIIGLNGIRVIGFLFLALAYSGQLSGPFPYFAGIGDIITALVAIALVARKTPLAANDGRVLAWNTLGATDLLVAVALGATSQSATVVQLPWALIPLFLVPCYLIGHAVLYAQAFAARSPRRSPA